MSTRVEWTLHMGNINIFLVISYDVLIGMDCLEAHWLKNYWYNKAFYFTNKNGKSRIVKDIPKANSIRKFLSLQLKKCFKKGCQLYVAHILDSTENKGPNFEDHLMLQGFKNVFHDKF